MEEPNQRTKSIPEMEDDTLLFWKENKVFEKSVEKNSADNSYVFYDGPPFISGLPHYGHLLGSIAKDVIPRYWTMKGKRVERVWGWDAHGLTVENKVQKRLDIKNRRDIEAYGLDKFAEESYRYTSEVSAEWAWYVDKIGRWVDFENAYKTTDREYMETVMWVFKQLYDKGLVYEGVRTSLFCTTCGTPVSNFEVAMDNSYKEVEDPAITVKFPVTSEGKFKNANILAWTTTPWTVPSNRALVVDENETYTLYELDGERYIAAKARLDYLLEERPYSHIEDIQGKELLGLSYEPPFRLFSSKPEEYKVYHYEGMANMEEGTGIVHSAPGFGEVDTEMGRHYGLRIMTVIDDEGKFKPGEDVQNPYEGMYYAKANSYIKQDLHANNRIFKDQPIKHRIPFHDRCNTLLIQKAQNSWFVDVQKLKPQLLQNNESINWVPAHLKEGRFLQGVEQAPDWCISRNRFWATPMPVWEAEDGDRIIVSSIKELEELSGMEVKDLHRPYIDEIVIKKDGKVYKRRPEVLDSWMEAGSMPYAQLHYPFENKDKFKSSFPGDFIVEYIGQVRAWFYVMHVLSTALFGTNSYKNVISTGVMAGSDGRKMSKTYGNYTDPKEILTKYGGDTLRLYLMASPLMLGENANFDETELKTKLRNTLNPLWNSFKFFDLYASAHGWDTSRLEGSEDLLDRWILVRTNEAVKDFSTSMEAYLVPPAVRALEEYVDDLSRWYVRRSRDRISSGDLGALSTLYTILLSTSKAFAPLIPFITESIYRGLGRYDKNERALSVHLEDYPDFDDNMLSQNGELLLQMSALRDIVSAGHAARTSAGLSVRQPLSLIKVRGTQPLEGDLSEILKDELNVKDVEWCDSLPEGAEWKVQDQKNISVALNTVVTEELKNEGTARDMVRKFQELRKEKGLNVTETLSKAVFPGTPENKKAAESYALEIKAKISADTLTPGESYEIHPKL
jgi:isoleucyl-tRNA synthetase